MDNYICTKEASLLANRTKETIRNWIRDFGIGKKIAGRWMVNKKELDRILNGEITYEGQGRPKQKN